MKSIQLTWIAPKCGKKATEIDKYLIRDMRKQNRPLIERGS
jgi:hypothetical protein